MFESPDYALVTNVLAFRPKSVDNCSAQTFRTQFVIDPYVLPDTDVVAALRISLSGEVTPNVVDDPDNLEGPTDIYLFIHYITYNLKKEEEA